MRVAVAVAGLVILGTVAGCGGAGETPRGAGEGGTVTLTPSVTASATAPAPTASASTPVVATSCPQLRDLVVGTTEIPLADYDAGLVQLDGGRYTSSDGAEVELQEPCAFGDLNGDGAADAVGAVRINTGGTGHFYSLVVWVREGSSLELRASLALGDRNPVREIPGIAGGEVTVVYLTRTDDQPAAALNVKRTATYALAPSGLVETGHSDEDYNPLNDG